MARDFSPEFKKNLLQVSPKEPFFYLLKITHPQLLDPIRVVRDKVDFQYGGFNWVAAPFDLALLPDEDKQIPKANISIANIGRDLVNWIEQSEGGFGAKVQILVVEKTSGAQIDLECKVQNITISQATLNVEIGYEDILNKGMVQVVYDMFEAPGLL